MSTYADFIEAGKASLFCYIGEDPYCSVFRRETSDKLGEPQVDGTKPTGLAVFIIDDEGTTTHELIFYDATESVQIPRDRVQKGETDFFVTNVDLCNRPDLLHRVLEALKKLGKNTIFSLSLDGSLVIRTPKSRLSPKKSAYKKIPLLFTV
jgi:sugar/nucleoside kinase (ribokinase family)